MTPRAPSMPFEPGDLVHVGQFSGTFEVISFDGSLYRLRAKTGGELRAGRKLVRPANTEFEPSR